MKTALILAAIIVVMIVMALILRHDDQRQYHFDDEGGASIAGLIGLLLALCLVAAGMSGCKSHHASSNPAVSANEAKAQKIVQACAAKANFLTANGRKAFYACIAPPGKEAEVQACAGKAFARDGVLTKAARKKFENDLAGCIVR